MTSTQKHIAYQLKIHYCYTCNQQVNACVPIFQALINKQGPNTEHTGLPFPVAPGSLRCPLPTREGSFDSLLVAIALGLSLAWEVPFSWFRSPSPVWSSLLVTLLIPTG